MAAGIMEADTLPELHSCPLFENPSSRKESPEQDWYELSSDPPVLID